MPAQLVIPSNEISNPHIMISDFGEAWLSDIERREELQTPVLFLPPETTFSKMSIGKPADVWTLGCTLYETLGERPLFEGFTPDKDDVIAEMVSTLGLLPQQWWELWQARGDFFLEDGSWKTDMERFSAFMIQNRGLYFYAFTRWGGRMIPNFRQMRRRA